MRSRLGVQQQARHHHLGIDEHHLLGAPLVHAGLVALIAAHAELQADHRTLLVDENRAVQRRS
jgi:hypothetical protein